ncbi:glycosyltransferase, partial [Roseateles sp. GG27B]
GALFEPGNVQSLVGCLLWASANEQTLEKMGLQARAHYEAELTSEVNYQQLLSIYTSAQSAVRLEQVQHH